MYSTAIRSHVVVMNINASASLFSVALYHPFSSHIAFRRFGAIVMSPSIIAASHQWSNDSDRIAMQVCRYCARFDSFPSLARISKIWILSGIAESIHYASACIHPWAAFALNLRRSKWNGGRSRICLGHGLHLHTYIPFLVSPARYKFCTFWLCPPFRPLPSPRTQTKAPHLPLFENVKRLIRFVGWS